MSYAINNLPSCITIGRETETAVTEIRIDCAEWLDRWPDMDVSVIVRTGRGAIYIPANLTMEGKTLVWCVDDVDTSILNKSTMEITGIAPDRHKLSEKVDILVDERLAGTTGETPDPMKPWVDRVIEAANTVGDARDDAVSAKDEAFDSANVAYKAAFDARESEKNAHASEQEAAQSANIAKDAEGNTRATLVTVNGLAEYAKGSAEMAKESEEKSLQNANNAGTYATSAKESEIIARESGETAKTSAQSAQTSAGSAAESANQAKRSEEAAKGYADNTGEYARIATEKAQKATEQANSAGVSATSAEESANRASAFEQNAATSAQEAKSSADSTKGYSESANEAAVNASDSAREAQVSAENAAASANNAEASKASAQVSAENARVSSQNAEDALQELRDKIASGEFKGEPGEPGKDAVVDATLTQRGQAADAKATGDALALKLTEPSTGLAVGKYFRIAAIDESGHAVLEAVDAPVGGLSTEPSLWPLWTRNEQAAARERMGIPGGYELIEEITLSESVDSVLRVNEPDGTAYNLVNAFLSVYIPIQDGGYIPGTIWVYFRDYKNFNAGRLFISKSGAINKNVYMRAEQRTSNGIWLNAIGEFGQENMMSIRMNVYNVKTVNSNITGINIIATLPAGTIIQIYGVRA